MQVLRITLISICALLGSVVYGLAQVSSDACGEYNHSQETLCMMQQALSECTNQNVETIESYTETLLFIGNDFDLECLTNKSSDAFLVTKKEISEGNIVEIQIKHDEYDAIKIKTLLTDQKKLFAFYADNDSGISFNLLGKDLINFNAQYFTYVDNYLYALGDNKYTKLPNGDLNIIDEEILVTGIKAYGDDGAFWFDAKLNRDGEIVEVIDTKDTKYQSCYDINELPTWIQAIANKNNKSTLCVAR